MRLLPFFKSNLVASCKCHNYVRCSFAVFLNWRMCLRIFIYEHAAVFVELASSIKLTSGAFFFSRFLSKVNKNWFVRKDAQLSGTIVYLQQSSTLDVKKKNPIRLGATHTFELAGFDTTLGATFRDATPSSDRSMGLIWIQHFCPIPGSVPEMVLFCPTATERLFVLPSRHSKTQFRSYIGADAKGIPKFSNR